MSKVVKFVASSSQKMVHITQLDGHFCMSLKIMSYVDLTEASLSYQSERLISFGYNWPLLFGQKTKLFLMTDPPFLFEL